MSDYSRNAWKYYEYGRAYNNSLTPNQYRLVETNTEFFAGNQWINMPDNEAMRRLSKPTFNIIKRITGMFVASMTSNGTTISFEPLAGQADGAAAELTGASGQTAGDAAEFATAEVRNLLEKFKMDFRIRDALFDGAITGDYCAHFFWNPEARPYGGAFGEYKGEIEMELIDGINVMFGNPNITNVEKQPYIIIVGRDTVENLKREAEYHARRKVGKADQSTCDARGAKTEVNITADSDWGSAPGAGQRIEIHGDDDKSSKATYIYMYTKEKKSVPYTDVDGRIKLREETTVHVTKATRSCTIFEDIDTGLSRFPVAWGNWQHQKNQYHGRALVTEVIPNQIFINQMMAMVFRHLQTQAFPTKIFNADLLPGISNEVGTAIGVRNLLPGQALSSVVSTLPAADMSNQIIQAIELCMQYTKECLGATDAQLGNLEANNTSALIVLQNASEVPLENTRAGLHEWMEDIGAILLDMMGTYYGVRPVQRVIDIAEPVLPAGAETAQSLIDPMTGESAGSAQASAYSAAAQTHSEHMTGEPAGNAQASADSAATQTLIDPMTGEPAGSTQAAADSAAAQPLIDPMTGQAAGSTQASAGSAAALPLIDPMTGQPAGSTQAAADSAAAQPLIDPMTGQPAVRHYKKTVLQDYDFSKFKHLWFNISVDAGASTYYSEIAMVQTLDNLRKEGALDIVDYLERIPDKLISRKQELIDKIKRREGISDDSHADE